MRRVFLRVGWHKEVSIIIRTVGRREVSWAAGRQMVPESVSDARQLLGIPAQTGADAQKVHLNNKCLEKLSAAEVCWSDFELTPMTLQPNHPGEHCASSTSACWMFVLNKTAFEIPSATTVILHLSADVHIYHRAQLLQLTQHLL